MTASLPTAELLEIDAPSWAPRAPMTAARSEATATLLKNGKVLVAGGVGLDTAELHDPAANTWAPTGNNMARPRSRHAMVTLVNGRVLVVGGQEDPTGSADTLRPADGPVGGCGLPGQRALEPHRHAAPVRRGAGGRGRGLERRRGDRRRALQPAPRAVGPDRQSWAFPARGTRRPS